MPATPHPLPSLFAAALDRHAGQVLFVGDDGRSFRREEALALAQQPALRPVRRQLVLCLLDNLPGALLGYLALCVADAVPLVTSAALATDRLHGLLASYQPAFAWAPDARLADLPGARVVTRFEGHSLVALPAAPHTGPHTAGAPALHDDLALLLGTSGSTGSTRFVRLSHTNVSSNAEAIARYLGLGPADRPITSLPPHYTYGLSVLHSHVVAGAALAVTRATLFDRGFWGFMREAGVTSFAGVPYHYEMLGKLRFWRQELPALRLLTQAGGRMAPEASRAWAEAAAERGIRYVTMYGQVEATARMAWLPPERAIAKAGSIGQAIPGGELTLHDEQGHAITTADTCGELVYRGPNVSLGYAEGRADLARGDDHHGVLRTGDLARRDSEGDFHIVGRLKRFLKLFGHRVNLEDIELALQGEGHDAACGGRDDQLRIYLAGASAEAATAAKAQVVARLAVHPSAVEVLGVPALPRAESGKMQYPLLDTLAAQVLA